MEYITRHNEQGLSYELGMNQFGDLTNAEFQSLYLSKMSRSANRSEFSVPFDLVATADPTSVDWRTKGYVTPIKVSFNKCC